MESRKQKLLIALILAMMLIIVVYFVTDNFGYHSSEGFETKEEKAGSIISWFSKNSEPKYTQYKKDFGSESNLVEYEDALKLHKKKDLTAESLQKIL